MMDFNVTGPQRKKLVKKLEAITGQRAVYQGMPSTAFVVGEYTVSKTGQITPSPTEDIVSALARAGFHAVGGQAEEEEAPAEVIGITITIPRDRLTDTAVENFRNMVSSKAALIQQAFGLRELPTEVGDEEIIVRWFEGTENTQYAEDFVRAMVDKAQEQKYVSPKPLVTDNPKYSFRVFLNALGFKGGDNKRLRKDLLANLEGSSAWRHGKPERTVAS